MRRICFVALTIVALSLAVEGRAAAADDSASTEVPRLAIGGFWSANLATFRYRPAPFDIASQQWNGVGATIDMRIGAHASIDARAMWNRKGATLTSTTGTVQEVRADYLSIPLLFKASTSGPVRVYAAAGPEVGFRMASRATTTLGVAAIDDEARAITRRTDVAADFGGGVERDLGRATLFVEGLYSHGLKNVVAPATPLESVRTRTVTLLAGVRF